MVQSNLIPRGPGKKLRLLYVHQGRASFVAQDLTLLSRAFDCEDMHVPLGGPGRVAASLARQSLTLARGLVSGRWQAILGMFAGYHTMLPALMGRAAGVPVGLILGGADAVTLPEVGYGHFLRPALARATALSVRQATLLLPVDASLIESVNGYLSPPRPQGVRHWVPGLMTPYRVVDNGFDPSLFRLGTAERPPSTYLTIASAGGDGRRWRIKGLDLATRWAQAHPHRQLTILGAGPEVTEGTAPLLEGVPPNISLVGPVPHAELPANMARHRYYVQLSMTEGFPNALCEAMLCGAVPIVTPVGAMPRIVDTAAGVPGGILGAPDIDELEQIANVLEARYHTQHWPSAVRDHIARYYPIEARAQGLIEAVEAMVSAARTGARPMPVPPGG